MKLTARNTHRDIAYFFVGLIIAFAFSGIFLNHRQSWHPRRYTYHVEPFTIPLNFNKDSINEAFVNKLTEDYHIDDQMRRFQVVKDQLRVSYVNKDVEVDLNTGAGTVTEYRVTPLLGQMTQLHQDTNKWWIWYSDIFGIAMLTLAFTGMFIESGSKSFRSRGWWLASLGLVFPLIFLFLLS